MQRCTKIPLFLKSWRFWCSRRKIFSHYQLTAVTKFVTCGFSDFCLLKLLCQLGDCGFTNWTNLQNMAFHRPVWCWTQLLWSNSWVVLDNHWPSEGTTAELLDKPWTTVTCALLRLIKLLNVSRANLLNMPSCFHHVFILGLVEMVLLIPFSFKQVIKANNETFSLYWTTKCKVKLRR